MTPDEAMCHAWITADGKQRRPKITSSSQSNTPKADRTSDTNVYAKTTSSKYSSDEGKIILQWCHRDTSIIDISYMYRSVICIDQLYVSICTSRGD